MKRPHRPLQRLSLEFVWSNHDKGLSDLLGGAFSHDQITRFLSQQLFDSKTLWQLHPAHPAAAGAVTRLSPGFRYYAVVRLLAVHPFPLRLSAYRVRYPGATRKHAEPSWGHVQIFRTVPLANTLGTTGG